MRRTTTILVSAALAAGCTASPTAQGSAPPPAPTTTPATTPSPVPGGCGTTSLAQGGLPPWTASANAPGGLPTVTAHEGNLVGLVFGFPLVAPARPNGPTNKILWISREPRNGSELVLTLTPSSGGPPVTVRQPADSSPGEIYPSIVDVPTAGCWNVVAEWAGHRATLELLYQRP